MKKFLKKHRILLSLLSILIIWRIYYLFVESIRYVVPQRIGYLGFIPQGNFDGVFYVNISQYWYRGLDQAFFPLYPISIWVVAQFFNINPSPAAISVSILSLLVLLIVFYKLLMIEKPRISPFWTIFMFLSFPTSFFLGNIYTESLFISFVLLSFYLVRNEHRILGSICAAFASGVRIVGIFLLPALFMELLNQFKKSKKQVNTKNIIVHFSPLLFVPLGLISYMGYLWYRYSDPLLFVHIQPAFGAGRSGGEIILLPQVIYRYVKIFLSVPVQSLTFLISAIEFLTLVIFLSLLIIAYFRNVRKSYIVFSFCVLVFPTLSGTLSSLPRYALASFAVFILLGDIRNVYLKSILIFIGFMLQAFLAILFFQGYFVS